MQVPIPRALLLLLCGLPVTATLLDGQAPGGVGPAAAGAIADVFSDIESAGPGCAAGVVVAGDLVYGEGFGLANLDYGLRITPRSNFYLGSVGKQFTAAAVAHAERAGHLSLDDPIQRWVQEIPEYDRPITIRHLIHHTSGLRDYLALGSLRGERLEDVHGNDDVLATIARQRAPNFPAGDEYLYSNTGYFLLGVVLQRATGLSLRAYLEKELLGPLGMTRTRVHDDRQAILPDRVVGYSVADGEPRLDHPWNFEQVGSGGVYSSLEDLARWDRNYYTEEVGGAGFTERLLERGMLSDGSTIPYAFGLVHGEYRGRGTVAHGGALAGFRSHLLRFPAERTTVLVLCNFPSSDPEDRARRVADVVLADRLEPVVAAVETGAESGSGTRPEPGPGAAAHAALVGEYYSEELDVTYRVYQEEDRLMLEVPPTRRGRLVPLEDGRWRGLGMTVDLERDGGAVVGFTIDAGRVRGIRFERMPAR